jgi:hypothetical protein
MFLAPRHPDYCNCEPCLRAGEPAFIPATDPEPPAPTQPLSVRDGDLLLIGRQGAVDEKGYVELGERFALSGVVGR